MEPRVTLGISVTAFRLFLRGLASPLNFSLALVLLSICLYRRRRTSSILAAVAFLMFFLLSTPLVSGALVESLESIYPERNVSLLPPAPAIVVLGGMLNAPNGHHPDAELGEGSDRLFTSFRLLRAGKAPLIMISGGSDTATSESRAAKDVLEQWGVPDSAILTEEFSRTTNQNAEGTAEILKRRGITRIILVTSATHMPRAVAAFRKVGFTVDPFPCDFRAGWKAEPFPLRLVPSAEALADSEIAVREWLGLAVYRVFSWA